MITTNLKSVIQSVPAVNALLAAPKLPAKASYAVSKLADACAREMQEYDKARAKVFVDAGCTIEENAYVHPDPEVMKKCAADIEGLLGIDVTLNANPMDIDQFGNCEVPGNAFAGLDWAMKQEG